jgi:hypothetical protein
VVSFIGFAGINILLGPSKLFGLPEEAVYVAIGLVAQGIF